MGSPSAYIASRAVGSSLGAARRFGGYQSRFVCTTAELKLPRIAVSTALFRNHKDRPEVLLIKRGKQPNKDLWSLPGGKVEGYEKLQDAARRELLEETAIDSSLCRILPHPVDVAHVPRQEPLFRIYVFAGICNTDVSLKAGDDAADVGFYATDELVSLPSVDGLESRVLKALGAILSDTKIASEFNAFPS